MPIFKTMIRTTLLFLFFTFSVSAQSPVRGFHTLSRPEKCWVLLHPFIAKKAYHITKRVQAVADSLMKTPTLDGDANGGQVDAFRHAYWMAMLVQKIPARKARKLGEAHEKGNYLAFKKHRLEDHALPDSTSCAMDRLNNKRGIEIGLECGKVKGTRHLPFLSIALVIAAVKGGSLFIISKNADGEALDCLERPIDMEKWKGKWAIPKCIVASNRVYRH